MTISFQILGAPGRDNAALVKIDTGQAMYRLLFDCGEGCLAGLPRSEIQAIDYLLFSHLHMDHVAGFDSFFRITFDRTQKPNRIYGPPETIRILQHRFQGLLWNMHTRLEASWEVSDIFPTEITQARFLAREAFSIAHPAGTHPHNGVIINTPELQVTALQLDHNTPSIGYVLREPAQIRIDPTALTRLGLPPGPWLRQVIASPVENPPTIEVAGHRFDLASLREALLVERAGASLAYLTDFRLDDAALAQLAVGLQGCDTLICESQYRADDAELARRNYHLTAPQAGRLAREAGVGRLVLFHLSDRYTPPERLALLDEARAEFAATSFSESWKP